MDKVKIIASYCLPALLAVALVLYGYYLRSQEVADTIILFKDRVELSPSAESLLQDKSSESLSTNVKRLIGYFESIAVPVESDSQATPSAATSKHGDELVKYRQVDISKASIEQVLEKVWFSNALYILSMVLLPFILFGSRLAFSRRLDITPAERLHSTYDNWWMKFIIACVISVGWVYVLNPTGRGESTLAQYLISVDLTQKDTIPIYIQSVGMVPVMAGFLGWYLYMLTYFFSKLIHHDVVSSRVYGLMFKKFLLTYGIAMILPSVELVSESTAYIQSGKGQSLLMFFVGYFPLAAFSMIKEKGSKLAGQLKSDTGYLSELPGISRWQVLRLEEEGIDNMAALSYTSHRHLHEGLFSMASIVSLWIDIAQLYVVVGHDGYQKLLPRCKSASSFINKVKNNDQEFIDYVLQQEIGYADEICHLLERTYGDKLVAYSQ